MREAEVAGALEQLKVEYIEQERAFQLNEKAEGWQLATDPKYASWVRQLFPAPKPARLSAPALETLAIIAYRQPITRADVEAVRGVNIDGVLQTLMERGLVKIAGRAEIPGRPLLYETTQFFLDHFGLRTLDELPNVEELRTRHLPVARPTNAGTFCVNAGGNAQTPGERARLACWGAQAASLLSLAACRNDSQNVLQSNPAQRTFTSFSAGRRTGQAGSLCCPEKGRARYANALGTRTPIVHRSLSRPCDIAFAEIQPADCDRAAQYSESKRGVSMLVMQNGRTIFERYANGGSARERWPIFSGTKSFWGIAALAAVHEGLFNLDDPVSDTITEWKSDSRKSQITIRQLLNQTDGIEAASRLQRASIRDRNAAAIQLPTVAEPGFAFIYGPSHLQIFSELLRRKLNGRATTRYIEARVLNRLGLRRSQIQKRCAGQSPARDRL